MKHSESTDSSEVDDITSLDDMHTKLDSEVDYKLISTPVVSSEAAPVCFQCFAKETILQNTIIKLGVLLWNIPCV